MQIDVAHRLNGVGEYYFSQKLREIEELNQTGDAVINLGIGSPDLPPHESVVKVLAEEAAKSNTHAYQSYKGIVQLRERIAQWYNKWYHVQLHPASEVLPLIGSKEGIMHVCMTYLNEGDRVLVPNPGYPTYRSAASIAGAAIVDYTLTAEHNWFPDFEQLQRIADEFPVKLMFASYPHMPTGQLPTMELFQKLVAFARANNILICHDNPYSFILNDSPMSILSVEGAKEVAIELNSLSKSHNMAGWRVGMLCGARERVDEVLRFKSNMDSGMFLPVQKAASQALSLSDEWFQQLNVVYAGRRQKVYELLDLLRCGYSKSQAGLFVWARIPHEYVDGFALTDAVLAQARVFITPGGIFGSEGSNYVRVSLCSSEDVFDNAIVRINTMFKTR